MWAWNQGRAQESITVGTMGTNYFTTERILWKPTHRCKLQLEMQDLDPMVTERGGVILQNSPLAPTRLSTFAITPSPNPQRLPRACCCLSHTAGGSFSVPQSSPPMCREMVPARDAMHSGAHQKPLAVDALDSDARTPPSVLHMCGPPHAVD
jgi:hypothetical protein